MERLAVCEVTIAPLPFEERIAAVAAADIPGYGVFRPLAREGLTGAAVRRAIDDAGLRPSMGVPQPFSILPIRSFLPPLGRVEPLGKPPDEAEASIIESLRWLAPIEPDAVMLLTGGQGSLSRQEAWNRVGEGLQRIAAEAQRLGFPILLELASPRYSSDGDFLESIDEARKMLEDVGSSNMGLLLDVFHIWELEDLAGQIERAKGLIGGVHLSDSSRFPRSVTDRLPPGQGVADVRRIIELVEATGFDGWYEIEVVSDDGSLGDHGFPDSWWKRPAEEMLDACVKGFRDAVSPAS